ncbi:MAG: leucine-rich repeat protein [Clostridiales bacterium]|nr:leucine-rich repeat protein [Clostridiales bacterium]
MKVRKPIILSILLALVAVTMVFAVSCGKNDSAPKTYTMSFETYGGTEIEPIKAIGGSMIFAPADPVKAGSTFKGWYTNKNFSGDPVTIPNIMPNKNIKYHAKFTPNTVEYTVTYVYNLGKAPHTADIQNVTVEAGGTVTVADGNDYGAIGHMFMGWSVYPYGLVADVKQDGQYNPGDVITVTDANITLYAQWAAEYTDSRKVNNDKIYVYEPLIDKGKGAAMLVRADKSKQDLDGFVASSDTSESGYTEFSFYSDEFDGGAFEGRLYVNRTYAVSDGMQGKYVQYDYIKEKVSYNYIMALDGFGFATYIRLVGDMVSVAASGDYEYDDEYGDYTFLFTRETDEEGTKPQKTYFNLSRETVEDTDFDGLFSMIGQETGTYGYAGEDNAPYLLELSGYGGATLNIFDDSGKTIEEKITGVYTGTEDYQSFQGEWLFTPVNSADSEYAFRFIIDYYQISSTEYIRIFLIRDDSLFGTYTSKDDSGSILALDGYGMAEYTVGGVTYVGSIKVSSETIVEFTVYVEENGKMVPSKNIMIFVLLSGNKFELSADGFIVNESGVLTAYMGKSSAVEIPQEVNDHTVKEIAEDAFNNSVTGVSLVSATVPASVTKIGARAFQNNYTLRRIIFLSDTPAAIDFTKDYPFRWGTGDFMIVVPQDAVDAYKTAWANYADKIIGSEDATKLPEFDIKDGVLVRYNRPEDVEEGTLLDLVIPEDVTEIADDVFLGLSGIKSVDLNNVETVGEYAFYGCEDLEIVKFTKVKTLGAMAFAACTKLNNSGEEDDVLSLPEIVTVGESAFSGCESLRLVQLGTKLKSIEDFAFYQCNVYENDPPLFVELLGENAPTMGSKIALGNISFRIKVQSIAVALKCYKASSWSAYCSHLYIESGEEKGMYISGDDTLELDGRALYQGSYVWMYAIDGEKITFYEYDRYDLTYNSIVGTYKNDEIVVAIGGRSRRFTRVKEQMTYTTRDGAYTLVCNPMDLQPDSYENYSGYADVKFNGKDVKLYINGYNTKIIYKWEEDGKLYDVSISFTGEVMEVSKKLSPIRYDDIRCSSDNSKISILIQNDKIYIVTAEFDIEVETGRKLYWTEASGMGVLAEQKGNVFTFSFRFRNDLYKFTATVSSDYKTFTYTYTKA